MDWPSCGLPGQRSVISHWKFGFRNPPCLLLLDHMWNVQISFVLLFKVWEGKKDQGKTPSPPTHTFWKALPWFLSGFLMWEGFKDRMECLHSRESSNARLTTPAAWETVPRQRQFKEETVLACGRESTNHPTPLWRPYPKLPSLLMILPYQGSSADTEAGEGSSSFMCSWTQSPQCNSSYLEHL